MFEQLSLMTVAQSLVDTVFDLIDMSYYFCFVSSDYETAVNVMLELQKKLFYYSLC